MKKLQKLFREKKEDRLIPKNIEDFSEVSALFNKMNAFLCKHNFKDDVLTDQESRKEFNRLIKSVLAQEKRIEKFDSLNKFISKFLVSCCARQIVSFWLGLFTTCAVILYKAKLNFRMSHLVLGLPFGATLYFSYVFDGEVSQKAREQLLLLDMMTLGVFTKSSDWYSLARRIFGCIDCIISCCLPWLNDLIDDGLDEEGQGLCIELLKQIPRGYNCVKSGCKGLNDTINYYGARLDDRVDRFWDKRKERKLNRLWGQKVKLKTE